MPVRKGPGSKYGSESFGAPGQGVTYLDVPPELLQSVVELVTLSGDCIMLSRTRDGGACHVRILADGLVEKWYAGHKDELVSVFEGIERAAGGLTKV